MTTDCQRQVAEEFGYELPVIFLASSKRYFKRANDLIDYLEEHEEELKNEVKEKEAMLMKVRLEEKEERARLEIETRKKEEPKTTSSLRKETERLYSATHCLVCAKNQCNIVLLPCAHFCLCSVCAKHSKVCPRRDCKTVIMEAIHVFLI